jgi:anti-anti-sigma factor
MEEREEMVIVELCERCGIVIGGELDMLTAPILLDVASEVKAADAVPVDVNLSNVRFIDASGLHALLCLKHTLPTMRVVAASPPVQRVLEITKTYDALVDPHLSETG